MTLERTLRIVGAAKGTIRQRERVIRRSPFGKQIDGTLQVRDRLGVLTAGGRDPPQSELGGWFSGVAGAGRIGFFAGSERAGRADQLIKNMLARLEVAS